MKETLTLRLGHDKNEELKKYIYAHRGYHNKPSVPENSMSAFKRAVERGWGIELDVHLTKDKKLVVFHDSNLKRITGEEGILEEKTWEELSKLRLEGTEERMPLFDEVLELTQEKVPLIIELKANENHRELSERVCKRLETYKGLFCIESFHPFAVADVREIAPEIVRGQLYMNFFKDDDPLPAYQKALLTMLAFDVKAKPDFIAYRLEDRNNPFLKTERKRGVMEVAWTIRKPEDLDFCLKNGIVPIFERFDPDTRQQQE